MVFSTFYTNYIKNFPLNPEAWNCAVVLKKDIGQELKGLLVYFYGLNTIDATGGET